MYTRYDQDPTVYLEHIRARREEAIQQRIQAIRETLSSALEQLSRYRLEDPDRRR